MPYAIAAKFAYPDRVSIAMVGDGAMQMGGMAEMLTAAKYYKTWADPRLIVLVLTNEDLNQVTWEQRVMEGDPAFEASQEIPYVDYAAWAQLIGLHGIKVTQSSEIEGAWREALSADRPVIISALTRPERAAAAAAYHLRTGREVREVGPRGPRRGPPGRGGVGAREGPRVPPGPLRCAYAADSRARRGSRSEHRIDRWVANIEHGRFERSLSGLTAFSALVTTAEVYAEHYRASFGNKMMWSPIVVTPPVVVAGVAGVYSKRWAKTVLPVASAVYMLDGLVGEYYHARGRRSAARGIWSGELQHPDGAADHGAWADVDRRRDGCPRRAFATGGLKGCPTCANPGICRTCAPAASRPSRTGCRVSVRARRRR